MFHVLIERGILIDEEKRQCSHQLIDIFLFMILRGIQSHASRS